MFSIICVFNDKLFYERKLLNSLLKQDTPYEIIAVDNTENKFQNASSALNYGARQAKGDFLLFAHQDIEFLSSDWLGIAEEILNRQTSLGWVGVAGCSEAGEFSGFLIDREWLFGLPDASLQSVQTLDECLLIHKRVEEGAYFDENVPGWHAYGVDACCTAISSGRRNFVLSLKTRHDSRSTNLQNLDVAHRYVWEKHKSKIQRIYTTCGLLPYPDWKVTKPKAPFKERARYLLANALTNKAVFRLGIEKLTKSFEKIDCLHKKVNVPSIEVSSFNETPDVKRKITHHFDSLNLENISSNCIVIAPDLTDETIKNWNELKGKINTETVVFVCLYLERAFLYPAGLFNLFRDSLDKNFFVNENGKTILVIRSKK